MATINNHAHRILELSEGLTPVLLCVKRPPLSLIHNRGSLTWGCVTLVSELQAWPKGVFSKKKAKANLYYSMHFTSLSLNNVKWLKNNRINQKSIEIHYSTKDQRPFKTPLTFIHWVYYSSSFLDAICHCLHMWRMMHPKNGLSHCPSIPLRDLKSAYSRIKRVTDNPQ